MARLYLNDEPRQAEHCSEDGGHDVGFNEVRGVPMKGER